MPRKNELRDEITQSMRLREEALEEICVRTCPFHNSNPLPEKCNKCAIAKDWKQALLAAEERGARNENRRIEFLLKRYWKQLSGILRNDLFTAEAKNEALSEMIVLDKLEAITDITNLQCPESK